MGDTEKAYELFIRGFRPNQVPPFGVISETAGGTNPYFATGAGGMLQAVLFGFGGLDITDEGILKGTVKTPAAWNDLKIKIK